MHILNTITHETIWGGEKLFPYSDGITRKIGHLYSLISNSEFESIILNGEYKNIPFKTFFENIKDKFNLDQFKEFPFAIALVEAKDDLSIQVHPNDEMARNIENRDFGKNESWYFIEAPNTKKIYNGSKCLTNTEFAQKIKSNNTKEVLDYLDVKSGDYVYVEAGTLHAMSAGSLVYEIEENCNLTYRVWDFDRVDSNGNKRELHVEKAVMATNPLIKSKTKRYEDYDEIKERLYATKFYTGIEQYQNQSETLECLTILKGSITIENIIASVATTIILEPNDSVNVSEIEFIVSRPKTGINGGGK